MEVFRSKFSLETRLEPESYEPLINFLAFLVQKLWSKNNKLINDLIQGCQTHFSSRATSGIFNLKRAGPVKSLHNILLLVMLTSNCFYNFNAKISSLSEMIISTFKEQPFQTLQQHDVS